MGYQGYGLREVRLYNAGRLPRPLRRGSTPFLAPESGPGQSSTQLTDSCELEAGPIRR